MSIDVYNFDSFAKFIREFLETKRKHNRRFSYAVWSRQLGLSSPSILAMIANGSRTPQSELMIILCQYFQFNLNQTKYAEAIVALDRANTKNEREFYKNRLQELRPLRSNRCLDKSEFDLIAHWYSVAIYECASLKEFECSTEWVYKAFDKQLEKHLIDATIERLLKLGLWKRQTDGRVVKGDVGFLFSDPLPNDTLRSYQFQLVTMAAAAIDQMEYSKRIVMSQTIAVEASKIPSVRQLMDEFIDRVNSLCCSQEGDQVYHLSTQFFPLTQLDSRPNKPDKTHAQKSQKDGAS